MARLLIAHSYHLSRDPKEAALSKPMPPLGPALAAAEAEAAGEDVALYDPTLTPASLSPAEAFAPALAGHRPQTVHLLADPFSIAQKQEPLAIRAAALEMIAAARAAGAAVVVEGPDPTDHPSPYERAGATVRPPPPPSSRPLVGLPRPAWHRVDLAAYARRWRAAHGATWELPVSAARGCPYRCAWCAKPSWGRSYSPRPPEEVAAEVRWLRDTYQPDRIWFADDLFGLKRDWIARYADALARTGPVVPFRALSRADLLAKEETVALLAAAGATEIWLGAESGSDAVLTAMDKDCTVAEIAAARENLRRHGIRAGFFLQLGYPGEDYPALRDTLRLARRLRPDALGVSLAYPLPGTPFYERVRAQQAEVGREVGSWEGSMDNQLLFEGDLPQAAYDAARTLLRSEHAALRARDDLAALLTERRWRAAARRAGALPLHLARWPLARWALHRAGS